MKKIIPVLFALFISLNCFSKGHPKLVVYLVFDQMRADYLLRYQNEFKKSQGKTPGGFLYLMEKGAFYPYAQYDVLQNMTCPGHAMISTGSWPVNNGISINEWFSKESGKEVYCVDDEKDVVSPRRLTTTTVSDEFKSLDKPSKVYGIALKDRSAIILAGHKADGVFWFNIKDWLWETSSYYKGLPPWVTKHNQELNPKSGDKNVLGTKWGVEATFNLAMDLIKNEKMGQTSGTDFLFLSFSTHDIAGHRYGPNSEEMRKLTLDEDAETSRFLNFLNQRLNLLNDVEIVLTADHGIPSTVDYSLKNKLNAGIINEIEMIEKIYSELNKKYSSGEKHEWFISMKMFHYFVNQKVLEKLKVSKKDFLETARSLLLKQNLADEVLIAENLKTMLPLNPQLRSQVQNSFIENQWGDLVIVPKPYFMNKNSTIQVNHITGYTYDRTVPLILFGNQFKPKTYFQKAFVVDIAPTIAASLGSLPGAKNDGRILFEIFKN